MRWRVQFSLDDVKWAHEHVGADWAGERKVVVQFSLAAKRAKDVIANGDPGLIVRPVQFLVASGHVASQSEANEAILFIISGHDVYLITK